MFKWSNIRNDLQVKFSNVVECSRGLNGVYMLEFNLKMQYGCNGYTKQQASMIYIWNLSQPTGIEMIKMHEQ